MAGGLGSKAKSGLRTGWHWPAIAVGMLLAGILVVWASDLFKVKTKIGTIVLENLPAGAEVLLDGDKVTVTWQVENGKNMVNKVVKTS